jgi:hypothetical protein
MTLPIRTAEVRVEHAQAIARGLVGEALSLVSHDRQPRHRRRRLLQGGLHAIDKTLRLGPLAPEDRVDQLLIGNEVGSYQDIPDTRSYRKSHQGVEVDISLEQKIEIVRLIAPAHVHVEVTLQHVVGAECATSRVREPAGPLDDARPERMVERGVINFANEFQEFFSLGHRLWL